MARSCNDCFHDCVCPHLRNDDAEKCGAYITDVAPVVHSSWEVRVEGNGWNEWSICRCKNCGSEYKDYEVENFCPNCGATMDETS